MSLYPSGSQCSTGKGTHSVYTLRYYNFSTTICDAFGKEDMKVWQGCFCAEDQPQTQKKRGLFIFPSIPQTLKLI